MGFALYCFFQCQDNLRVTSAYMIPVGGPMFFSSGVYLDVLDSLDPTVPTSVAALPGFRSGVAPRWREGTTSPPRSAAVVSRI